MIYFAHPFFLLIGGLLLLPYLLPARRAWQYSCVKLLQEGKKITLSFLLISGVTCGALILLLIALARPQKTIEHQNHKLEVRDILLTLDLSLSMEGKIFSEQEKKKIRKLDLVQRVGLEFVQHHRYDRLGLIVFGDDAFGVWPLSTDSTVLQKYLQRLDTLLPSELRGTYFEKALLKALDHFQELGQAKTKSLLLLTDGLDTIDPKAAKRILERLRKHAVTLYLLGIQLRENSSIIQLTQRAHGHYFNIHKAEELEKALWEINQLERSRVAVTPETEIQELYPLFVFPGLFLLLLSLVLKQTWVLEI